MLPVVLTEAGRGVLATERRVAALESVLRQTAAALSEERAQRARAEERATLYRTALAQYAPTERRRAELRLVRDTTWNIEEAFLAMRRADELERGGVPTVLRWLRERGRIVGWELCVVLPPERAPETVTVGVAPHASAHTPEPDAPAEVG